MSGELDVGHHSNEEQTTGEVERKIYQCHHIYLDSLDATLYLDCPLEQRPIPKLSRQTYAEQESTT